MWSDTIWVLIPIVAISGGIIKSILASQEKRLKMRLKMQQGENDEFKKQIADLRAEIAALRDTSTQFDLSLDNSVQRLESRVGHLESKAVSPALQPAVEETHYQSLGRS